MNKLTLWLSKALTPFRKALSAPMPWGLGRGWFPVIHEPYGGAWQRNAECRTEDALSFAIVWRCLQLISEDISKLPLSLIQEVEDGIWEPTENTAHTPFLRKPNQYQTRIQFYQSWVLSKYIAGNTYILKERDQRGLVVQGHVLDPTRVKVLVADDGSVVYELSVDNLAGVSGPGEPNIRVPASEIIHDRLMPVYHPLVGISALRACALAAMQGLKIQGLSSSIFDNGAQPSGILTSAAGNLSAEVAKEIQDQWQQGFTGANRGKVAVLGADLKYQKLQFTAVDIQLVEQLRLSGEFICSCLGVPKYKVGLGDPPAYGNVQAVNVQYYTDCLQHPIECIELLLDEGQDLPSNLGVEFDTDALLRMDTLSLVAAAKDSIASGGMSPNEARKRYFGLRSVSGGDSPYLQQQNFSLEALAKRDAQEDPFANTPRRDPPGTAPTETDVDRAMAPELIAKAIEAGLVDAA